MLCPHNKGVFRRFDRVRPVDQTSIFQPDQGIFILTRSIPFSDGGKYKFLVFLCQMFWNRIPNPGQLGDIGCGGMFGKNESRIFGIIL